MFYNTASVLWGFFGQEAHGIPSRDQNRTPCIGRQSLNPWTPSEVPKTFVFRTSPVSELRWGEPEGAGWLQCRSPGPSPRGSNSVAAGGGAPGVIFQGPPPCTAADGVRSARGGTAISAASPHSQSERRWQSSLLSELTGGLGTVKLTLAAEHEP